MVVGDTDIGTDVLVIGAGPAGYAASISCARHGLDVFLAYEEAGGDPMLYANRLIAYLKLYGKYNPGHAFGMVDRMRQEESAWMHTKWKAAGVQALKGKCSFISASKAVVSDGEARQRVGFTRAIVATGARYRLEDGKAPGPSDVLSLKKMPGQAAVVGCGPDAIAIASILSLSGCKVTLSCGGRALPGMDPDVANAVKVSLEKSGVIFADAGSISPVIKADKTEAAIDGLGLENSGIKLENGFIKTDEEYRTDVPSIYAIGGAAGVLNPCVAARDGNTVSRIMAGRPWVKPQFVPILVSSITPAGSTGMQDGINTVTGRAETRDGFVKVVAEKSSGRLLGVHCLCENAHGIIAEATLALEMAARLDDILLTAHPYAYSAFTEACESASLLSRKGP